MACSDGGVQEPTIRPPEATQNTQQFVSLGAFDASNRFPYVVSFNYTKGSSINACSGILVTPTTILTARHCFVPQGCTALLCTDDDEGNPSASLVQNINVGITNSIASNNCGTTSTPSATCLPHTPGISGSISLMANDIYCGCSLKDRADDLAVFHLWVYSIYNRTWLRLPLQGPAPQRVLASTYWSRERSLFVLDEVPSSPKKWVRLLQIDLSSNTVKVVGQWPRLNQMDKFFLSNTLDGRLLLTASSSKSKHYRAFVFEPKNHENVVCSFHGSVELAMEPVVTNRGYSIFVTKNGETSVDLIPPESRECRGNLGWKQCL